MQIPAINSDIAPKRRNQARMFDLLMDKRWIGSTMFTKMMGSVAPTIKDAEVYPTLIAST